MARGDHRHDRDGWRGNKSALPSKPCTVCGRPMGWRRAWAKTWGERKVCSAACRRQRGRMRQGGPAVG